MRVTPPLLAFAFSILMALDSEIIPVKRKINILIRLLLHQLEISKLEVVEKKCFSINYVYEYLLQSFAIRHLPIGVPVQSYVL